MRARSLLLWALLLIALAGGMASRPSPSFHPPLQSASTLVASFAEYRPDHLHPGVDLSTGGRTGLPVYAVMAGEIFRLKVEWRGYGRAVYLRHADGRISVYAHLERFDEAQLKLETRVEQARKSTGSKYPGDIYLDPPVPVRQGQQIATSGESGAGLPHLHFELRKDEQRPGDPSPVLGRLPGGESPRLETLVLLADEAGVWVNGARVSEVRLSRDKTGTFVPDAEPMVTGPFFPEARIVSEDREGHHLGIESLMVKLDGKVVYRTVLREFRFDQYPQVGLLLDHARSRLSPSEFTYRLARLPGNTLGLVGAPLESAWPSVQPGRHQLQLEVTGALGARTSATIPLRVVSAPQMKWVSVAAGEGESPRVTLRVAWPAGEAKSSRKILYTPIGTNAPVPCGAREILPDGESCTFPDLKGVLGLTATALLDGIPVARSTHLFPLATDQSPSPLECQAVPGMNFVDLEIPFTRSARDLPSRLVVAAESDNFALPLTELEPGVLVASVPLEHWQRISRIDAEWDTQGGPVRASLSLAVHTVTPDKSSEMDDCGLKLSFPVGSIFAPTAVACSVYKGNIPSVEGLDLKSPVVSLLPEGTPLSRKASVLFSPPGGTEGTRRLGIYRLDRSRGEWAFLGGEASAAGIAVGVGRFDTLALLEDRAAPRILGVMPSLTEGTLDSRPHFVVRVEDNGSGLNYDGVHLAVDGDEVEMEYDPDRGWSTGGPERAYPKGSHTLRLWAEDRSGNRTQDATFTVMVP